MIDFFGWLLTEGHLSESVEVDVLRNQINGLFDSAVRELLAAGKVTKPEHAEQAEGLTGYDWWGVLLRVMRNYPYKGQDLYDAVTHLASDLWERVFDPRKYEDRNPPLAVFKKMAAIRGQNIAFRFFGWRRKMKVANLSDVGEVPIAGVTNSDVEWNELKSKVMQAVETEAGRESNRERARRAIDVASVKLTGLSKLYNKPVTNTGLDGLAAFYRVNRREMYDTFLVVYRAVREMAKGMGDADGFLSNVMGELPQSLRQDPEEIILSLIPTGQEISHSELFTKAYSSSRELKALTFKNIIQKLLDRKEIDSRKDDRAGKHQTLYLRR